MDLGPEETRKVQDWMKGKYGAEPECPACKKTAGWDIARGVFMSELGEGTGYIGIRFPEVLVTCENCGFVLHLSAVKVGLLESTSYGFKRTT